MSEQPQQQPHKIIKACLFDMDGLLINSEEIYTQVTNEVLAEHGKGELPWEVKIELQGRPGPDASRYFLEWSKLPYTPDELFQETSRRQKKLWHKTEFMPGAAELLAHLAEHNIPIALATSSHRMNFTLKTNHLNKGGFELFGDHIVVGDDPRIPAGRGKPHPDIWLVALESLNAEHRAAAAAAGRTFTDIKPEECLVFEDGLPGVTAGKAAGATVIWVPDARALKVLNGREVDIIGDSGEILESLVHLDKAKYGLDKPRTTQ
ncbi:similar to Saccharomyces cerevisiae YKL033W-A Putative protein of unknown function [Geotrichum candidum]|uniref:Uncharacterized protein n=1 Tax=Geotrichum candidum TaxID=1173061 RepID=A0A0J9XKI3_GEOCN|nr:similar to Saccharomyces cerevisiae YKL033W-A Putative protein of unknown function [Geotrichum candidum]